MWLFLLCLNPVWGVITVITGATGQLGSALGNRALQSGGTVVLGCRDKSKLPRVLPPSCFELQLGDLTDLSSISEASVRICTTATAGSHSKVVLINAAGVCLAGSGRDILAASVTVNALYPVLLATSIHRSLIASTSVAFQVINVSSLDGQSCYLNSQLAAEIAALDSLTMWEDMCRKIVNFPVTGELAFSHGGTPAYSVSKALLTKGSALLQQEWQVNVGAATRQSLCLCPGDFMSRMTTAEELQRGQLRDVDVAAGDVWDMVSNPGSYRGGGFYHMGDLLET